MSHHNNQVKREEKIELAMQIKLQEMRNHESRLQKDMEEDIIAMQIRHEEALQQQQDTYGTLEKKIESLHKSKEYFWKQAEGSYLWENSTFASTASEGTTRVN